MASKVYLLKGTICAGLSFLFLVSHIFIKHSTAGTYEYGSNKYSSTENVRTDNQATLFTDAGFFNAEIRTINDLAPSKPIGFFTHEFTMSAVLFRDAGWAESLVVERLRNVSNVYAQCGIRLNSATLIISDPFEGTVDIKYSDRSDARITKALPKDVEKPIIFYIRNNLENQNAYAWNRDAGRPAHITDTVWITAHHTVSFFIARYKEGYSVEAHELGHVFMNTGHVAEGVRNFLAGRVQDLNNQITGEQCREIKKSDLVREI